MLFFCLLLSSSAYTFYDSMRNYTEAFMTGYENPSYVFPSSSCLPPATQTAITDKTIGVLIFLSGENWAQVRISLHTLAGVLESAATACDLNLFYNKVVSNKTTSFFEWVARLWWNSVLLYRNCPNFFKEVFADPVSGFHSLGECAKFLYPNS
jgi:hypothetical protein